MFFNSIALATAFLASTTLAGDLIWDGRFNASTATNLDAWSWSNQVGAYQWYIHGTGSTSDYVNIDTSNVQPADTSSTSGARLTIDTTSSWNGQTMLRTELIPQTSAAINKGKKYYHFSLKHSSTNAPDSSIEHQVAFFESHFTELKFGASGSKKLQWFANSEAQFDMDFTAGVWHNVAYGIDFDANTVEFFHSTGAEDLVSKKGPVSATVNSNGADWHLGVLRLDGSEQTEDWYFSSVYIEEGEITKSVSGPGGSGTGSSSEAAASSVVASSSAAPASSSASAVQSSSSVTAVSSQAAVVQTSSSAAADTPTTLQTLIRSSSSSASATSNAAAATAAETSQASVATSSNEAFAATETGDAGSCAIEYVYV